ncbi:MAG TPA: aldo/keto reductase [Sphingomonas sp.]|nr:aldo/keto reductase [Sphingomonas sp.]
MTLPVRQLGPFSVSAVGLGAMGLSHAYDVAPSAEDGGRLLNGALDLGITLIDTAALYGGGGNEELIGAAIMHRKAQFVLASKCVLEIVDGKRLLDGSPEAITRSVERSLARLNTDHIDLLYLHRPDPHVAIEDSVGALVRLKEAGKIGAIGLSEMSADTIRRAQAVHPIAAVQTEYSAVVRNPEIAVLETCRELGIGFVAFSPVARGLLAGAIHGAAYAPGDIRSFMPRFVEPNLTHNLQAVAAFDALAAEIGATPAQLALAWVLSRGDHIVPIPGTRSIAHLKENLGAADLSLSPETFARVETIFAPGAIRGARYLAPLQAQVTTETFPAEELD